MLVSSGGLGTEVRDHPRRFVKIVRDFMRSTEPSRYDAGRWRELLDQGAPVAPLHAGAGRSPRPPVVAVRRAKPA